MNQILSILILVSFLSLNQNDRTSKIDKYVASVEMAYKNKKLISKEPESMSSIGGAVTGYYSDTKLILIQTVYAGEYGYQSYDFYLKNDTLVFVKEVQLTLKVDNTAQYEEYVKKHTNKAGDVDLSEFPLKINDVNTYYFDNDSIIDFTMKSFNISAETTQSELQQINLNIISRFKTHLAELR